MVEQGLTKRRCAGKTEIKGWKGISNGLLRLNLGTDIAHYIH